MPAEGDGPSVTCRRRRRPREARVYAEPQADTRRGADSRARSHARGKPGGGMGRCPGFGGVFPRDKRGRGRHALLQFLVFLGVAGLTLGAPRLLSGRPGRCRITPRPNRDGQECPQMLSCVPAAPADAPGAGMRKARGPLVPGAVPHTVGCSPPVCPLAHPRLQVSVLSRQCQMLPEGPERPTPTTRSSGSRRERAGPCLPPARLPPGFRAAVLFRWRVPQLL